MDRKRPNWLFRIFVLLFLAFCVFDVAIKTGYYQERIRKKTLLTEEKIKEFESDIANGKVLDIKTYLPEQPDYGNVLTKSEYAISQIMSKLLNNGSKKAWKMIKTLFID